MTAVYIAIGLIVGVLAGYFIARTVLNNRADNALAKAEALIKDSEKQAENLLREAKINARDEAYRLKQEAQNEAKERNKELKSFENRLLQREESLDRRAESLDKRDHQLSSFQGQLDRQANDLEAAQAKVNADLQRVAGMTAQEAKAELLASLKDEVNREAATIIRNSELRVKDECGKKSREILSRAIQRVAADHSAETTVSTVHIPNEELKGRIIGREGRNIRTFEQLTGVNLIIDDTPETVVLSGFDPVRREISRVTLENLIADGRIHPARIEEMFNKATDQVLQAVRDAGEQVAFDANVHDLHPDIIKTLGRLKYRTSYGQNVLNHSLEVSHLAGVMAAELGLDPAQAKRAGLLHDLGKAIDHEVEGSHAVIGAELARRYGESPAIVHAIEAHHGDVEPNSVVAVLVQAADAVSAARPGARRETLEMYIKRLEKLEEIATAHAGVERVYAMQAGREVRIMVEPDSISDADSIVLAHDIAKQIEEEMEYPGQIHVLVIRESRAEDYAK